MLFDFKSIIYYLHVYIIDYFLNRPIVILRYSPDKERAIHYSEHALFSIAIFKANSG